MNANALLRGSRLRHWSRQLRPYFLSKAHHRQKEQNKSKRWSPMLRHSSIIKERQLSMISERKTASGFTLTRICLSTI